MEKSTDLKEIIAITGKEPSQCSCEKCANMCRRLPCLGTPHDILTLIENGYIDNLQEVVWATGVYMGMPPIDMVQLKTKQDGSCVFFDNNLCNIHAAGIKPTEGKLALHSNSPVFRTQHVSIVVAKTWLLPKNQRTILKISQKLINHTKQQNDATK